MSDDYAITRPGKVAQGRNHKLESDMAGRSPLFLSGVVPFPAISHERLRRETGNKARQVGGNDWPPINLEGGVGIGVAVFLVFGRGQCHRLRNDLIGSS